MVKSYMILFFIGISIFSTLVRAEFVGGGAVAKNSTQIMAALLNKYADSLTAIRDAYQVDIENGLTSDPVTVTDPDGTDVFILTPINENNTLIFEFTALKDIGILKSTATASKITWRPYNPDGSAIATKTNPPGNLKPLGDQTAAVWVCEVENPETKLLPYKPSSTRSLNAIFVNTLDFWSNCRVI